MPDPNNPASYATRNDGTQKDSGFLGPITDSQGNSMTEFSIGVNIDGKETEIPTLVPTLSPEEIEFLRTMQPGTPMPPAIVQKAVDHAKQRMQQGASPFYDSAKEGKAMPDKRSFLQKAFMDPPKRPNGEQPWNSLTQEEKDALSEQQQKDRLYGRNTYEPSYLAQGMKFAMEALGPKPKDVPQAKVPDAQTWNQYMDTQDAARKAQAQTRTFTTAFKKAGTIEERWKALKEAQSGTPK